MLNAYFVITSVVMSDHPCLSEHVSIMFTPTSFGAEFTFDWIISHVRVRRACETNVHWVHSIRRKSVIDALFKTTLKLLNRLFEWPFV